MDIYVVSQGRVLEFLQDAHLYPQLPVLPPEINRVRITWMAPDDEVRLAPPSTLQPHNRVVIVLIG